MTGHVAHFRMVALPLLLLAVFFGLASAGPVVKTSVVANWNSSHFIPLEARSGS